MIRKVRSSTEDFVAGGGKGFFPSVHSLTSQLIASPAMADIPVSHNQRRTSVEASTPACSGALLSE